MERAEVTAEIGVENRRDGKKSAIFPVIFPDLRE
jgi:hypothetical protein